MNPTYLINQDAQNVLDIPQNANLPTIFVSVFNSSLGLILGLTVLIIMLSGVYSLMAGTAGGSVSNKSTSKDLAMRGLSSLLAVIFVIAAIWSMDKNLLSFSFLSMSGKMTGAPASSFVTAPIPQTQTQGKSTASCANPEVLKDGLKRGVQLCSNAVCSKVCRFDPTIRSIAIDEASKANIPYGVVLALICRESSGDPNLVGKLAVDGKPDCGLMQLHTNSCGTDIMDPRNNIKLGIKKYQEKLAAASKFSYTGVSQESMAFASYNCCSNGDNPNSKSNDCSTATGFPVDLPKWGCPINPGDSAFNMCKVKDYACDVDTCSKKY